MSAPPSEPAVQLRDVGKRYGQRWALEHLDLDLAHGEILGFIGPNGAGKTTLMKLLGGLSQPTTGELRVLGVKSSSGASALPPAIGLMMESDGFIPSLSGRQNLSLLARIRNIATASDIDDALRRTGLDPGSRQPVRSYSLGMRQRLGLAQAIMERPKLLLLDEPANGLDPLGIIELRSLLDAEAARGAAILLASHMLTEVERVCSRVVLVHRGRLLREIVPTALAHKVLWRLSSEADASVFATVFARDGIAVERLAGDDGHPTFRSPAATNVPSMTHELALAGAGIEAIIPERRSLEEEFLDATRAATDGGALR